MAAPAGNGGKARKAAGEVMPPSNALTGLGTPRRSVSTLGAPAGLVNTQKLFGDEDLQLIELAQEGLLELAD
jgi:hypothetical protein